MKTIRKLLHGPTLKISLVLIFSVIFELLLYKIFSRRALSFGCFDDCANYMAGYFMVNGKTLYSQIFFNHIMGMADLSSLIQKLHYSINIYDLVLTHRKVIMLSSFLFGILLMFRFSWKGFLFVVLYELSKFYVFGDRFLGESIAVYAAVYLLGLSFEKFYKKELSFNDYVFSGFLTFLIIFMREPYIPLALILFTVILAGKFSKQKLYGTLVFLILIAAVLFTTDLPAYYFNDVTVNLATAIKGEAASNRLLGIGAIQVFFYPVFIFFTGKFNFFHYYLMCLSLVFCLGIIWEMYVKKSRALPLVLLVVLGLANIRVTPPGTTYFEAYHMMVWYGLFLFSSIWFAIGTKKLRTFGLILIVTGWGIVVFGPGSYLYNKIDLQESLLTNFGKEMHIGTVVHDLSKPTDTLFLDGADDMIYWQAKRLSPYKYSWYTSVMPLIPVYKEARMQMFKANPPVFYFDYCSKLAPLNSSLPEFVKKSYLQLYENNKPSCLYVLKSKISEISQDQWGRAKEGFFSLPSM